MIWVRPKKGYLYLIGFGVLILLLLVIITIFFGRKTDTINEQRTKIINSHEKGAKDPLIAIQNFLKEQQNQKETALIIIEPINEKRLYDYYIKICQERGFGEEDIEIIVEAFREDMVEELKEKYEKVLFFKITDPQDPNEIWLIFVCKTEGDKWAAGTDPFTLLEY